MDFRGISRHFIPEKTVVSLILIRNVETRTQGLKF